MKLEYNEIDTQLKCVYMEKRVRRRKIYTEKQTAMEEEEEEEEGRDENDPALRCVVR